jgi:hypothetical protein
MRRNISKKRHQVGVKSESGERHCGLDYVGKSLCAH